MIATDSKAKLPKGFSYPLGAEKINSFLGDIPQAETMKMKFEWRDEFWVSSWRKRIDTLGVVTLVEATFWEYFNEWRLFVYAVPKEFNVSAREFLVGGQLQELGNKLRAVPPEATYFRETISFRLKDANVC